MRLERKVFKTPEFEQREAAIEKELHHADYCKAHPEDLTANLPAPIAQALAPLMFPRPPLFNARVGKRTAFRTTQEAVQYERGFASFPTQPWGLPDSPAMRGYFDAEVAHAEALYAQEERRESNFLELT